jgi:hypothetical protein
MASENKMKPLGRSAVLIAPGFLIRLFVDRVAIGFASDTCATAHGKRVGWPRDTLDVYDSTIKGTAESTVNDIGIAPLYFSRWFRPDIELLQFFWKTDALGARRTLGPARVFVDELDARGLL